MEKEKRKEKIKQKITKEVTFAQVLKKYPQVTDVFFKHGMMCVGCPMAMQETIEQGCKAHGINVKKLLEELNKKLKKK